MSEIIDAPLTALDWVILAVLYGAVVVTLLHEYVVSRLRHAEEAIAEQAERSAALERRLAQLEVRPERSYPGRLGVITGGKS